MKVTPVSVHRLPFSLTRSRLASPTITLPLASVTSTSSENLVAFHFALESAWDYPGYAPGAAAHHACTARGDGASRHCMVRDMVIS